MFLHLPILTNLIVRLYFKETNCVYMFIDSNVSEMSQPINISVVIFGIKELNIQQIPDSLQGFQKAIAERNILCGGFVIQTKQYASALLYIESFLYKLNGYQFNSRKYLILPTEMNSTNNIFDSSYTHDILDVLIVTTNHEKCEYYATSIKCEEVYNLYTYSYTKSKKGKESTSFIDQWSSTRGFHFGQNLYPDKAKDLQGMIIKTIAFDYLPYVVFDPNYSKPYGIDISILELFAKTHNGTLIIIQEKERDWLKSYDLISRNQADVALDGFQLADIYENMDLTTIYHHTKVVALVPKPRLLKGISTPFIVFSFHIYIILLILYIVFTLIHSTVMICTNKNSRPDILKICVEIYGMFLSQSPYRIILIKYKKILLWMYLTSWLVSILYNTGAASILIVPSYERPINTIDDLVESNLKLGAVNAVEYSLPLISSESTRDKQVIAKYFDASYEELNKIAEQRGSGLVLEETKYNHYAPEYIYPKTLKRLQLMRETICWVPLTFGCRKQWGLTPYLNNHIHKVLAAGLVYHWEQKAVYAGSKLKYQTSIRYSTDQEYEVSKLEFTKVYGAFVSLFIGLLLSFVVFIFEVNHGTVFNRVSTPN